MSDFTLGPAAPPAGTPGNPNPGKAERPLDPGTRQESPLPLTIVIPTLNAAIGLDHTLAAIAGAAAEILVVDGGSTDDTAAIAARHGATLREAHRGRGAQLQAGAAAATSPWLLFLHADTVPAPGWRDAVARHLATPALAAHFRFALDDPAREARRLERWVARRCRWLALPYGDQGLLIHRDLHARIGGFRPIPIMEDVDIVRRLGRRRLVAIDLPFVTSAERWRREGWGRRSRRNLACLALWFLGLPPDRIARFYRGRG